MRQRILKVGQYVVPAICALALGACFHPSPPDGAIAPAGAYGGTVVAYPMDPMAFGYGFPYAYGYDPYGAGGYGYSPYAYGYSAYGLSPYAYPSGVLYQPIYRYRVRSVGRIGARHNGQYGLQPWGGLRSPTGGNPLGSPARPRQAVPRPMKFALPPLRSSAVPIAPRAVTPPRPAQPRPQRQQPSRSH